MRVVDLIQKKKHGLALTKDELHALITEYVAGRVPDYQMAALLMAVCFVGMTAEETAALTDAMTHSGDVIDLSAIKGVKVDKHSTGGVGDTTTLILAPLVSACGVPVAKMSGRGLGHTGGTLDKLESAKGVNVTMEPDEFTAAVNEKGIAVIGQTGDLVPADKLLYALRDVTATVDSVPLIASSIMSKKIAAGSDAIVLDVKTGSGAFMNTPEKAEELGRVMVSLGDSVGRKTIAVITDMSQPLGCAVGNALELREAIIALRGGVPLSDPLMRVTLELGKHMLMLSGAAKSEDKAEFMLIQALKSGAGLEKLRTLLQLLGGDSSCCDLPDTLLRSRRTFEFAAKKSGTVLCMDTIAIGETALLLGAGRSKKTDKIDPDVGFIMHVRIGDTVSEGDSIATFYVNDETNIPAALEKFQNAVHIGAGTAEIPTLIYSVVGNAVR